MGMLRLRLVDPWHDRCKGTNDKGQHISGANRPRGVSNKGHNIQEFPVRDSPVRDAITLHRFYNGNLE